MRLTSRTRWNVESGISSIGSGAEPMPAFYRPPVFCTSVSCQVFEKVLLLLAMMGGL